MATVRRSLTTESNFAQHFPLRVPLLGDPVRAPLLQTEQKKRSTLFQSWCYIVPAVENPHRRRPERDLGIGADASGWLPNRVKPRDHPNPSPWRPNPISPPLHTPGKFVTWLPCETSSCSEVSCCILSSFAGWKSHGPPPPAGVSSRKKPPARVAVTLHVHGSRETSEKYSFPSSILPCALSPNEHWKNIKNIHQRFFLYLTLKNKKTNILKLIL